MDDTIKNIEDKIKSSVNDLEKIDMQNQLAFALRLSDPRRSLTIAEDTYKAASDQSYLKGKSEALRLQTMACNELSMHDQSFRRGIEALRLFRELEDKLGEARILNLLGNTSFLIGDYENSLKYHILSLQIREEINDMPGIIACYTNIGSIYVLKKDYEIGLDYFLKGLDLAKKASGRPNDEAMLMVNIGSIYSEKGEYKKALDFYLESLERGLTESKDFVFASIAKTYFNLGDLINAEKYYLIANESGRAHENKFIEAKTLLGLGEIAYSSGNYDTSIRHLEKALNRAPESASENVKAEIYQLLSEAWVQKKDFETAFDFHKKFFKEKEREFTEEAQKKTQNLLVLHQVDVLKKESEVQRSSNDQLKKLNEEVELKNKSIMESINYAKHIQDSILPHSSSLTQYFSESFVFHRPKDIISGDFFWMYEKENDLLIAAVDCTGHGVSGALMSVVANSVLNQVTANQWMPNPSFVLNEVNHFLGRTLAPHDDSGLRDTMDIALCSINKTKTELIFTGAHNPMYHISEGVLTEYKGDPISIGNSAAVNFSNHRVKLKKGDCFYIFTDGYADQKGGPSGKKFYYPPFKTLLLKIYSLPMEEQNMMLGKAMDEWMENEKQIDDMLIIGIKI